MSRLTINSNIPSLNAQRSLSNATKRLGDSYTRLSSGLRINKASDDAAGLSISESLKADTRLFNQGIRNLNDGVSLLNIADGALNELSNITIRLRELATQSSNGTFSNKQRLALDQEAQSLSKEYNRITRTTEFNGRKIFNGDFGDLSLAAGGGRESLVIDDLGGAIGDGTLQARISYQTFGYAIHVAPGDLNQDGIQDLIIADQIADSIGVMLGNGDGTFRKNGSYVGGDEVFFTRLSDFNNDGKIDAVVADRIGNSISVFLGNGDGSFKTKTSYLTVGGSNIGTIDVADLNQDGIVDVLATSIGTNAVYTFLGNSNGSFNAARSYVVGTSPTDPIIRDFNGDSILDIASPSSAGSVEILLGNSDGSFKTKISYASGALSNAVSAADFDGDGVIDLVVAEYGASGISIFRGNGDGSFKTRYTYISSASTGPAKVNVGDFNGDGISDIFTLEYSTNTQSIFLGNGNGSFQKGISYTTGGNSYSQASADFNGDGVLDTVTADSNDNVISVLLANSNSGVSALQSFSLKTKQESKQAMDYLSGALNRISKQRGEIGAFRSRLDVATSTLQTSSLNYQEANSRITDIDVAEESSRLAATQILQQSAASILAQANQQPQLVLNLLRDL